MKAVSIFKRVAAMLLVVLLLLTSGSKLIAQNKSSSDLKDFKISIEKTDNGIKMYSLQGSAWINLNFRLADNKTQVIDEYGMTETGKPDSDKSPNLADYLFCITKTKDRIILTGIEGTAWRELSFILPKNGKQTINQYGMTD